MGLATEWQLRIQKKKIPKSNPCPPSSTFWHYRGIDMRLGMRLRTLG